jgi:cytochrome P450
MSDVPEIIGPLWAVTRHEEARAMLTDPRFELNANSYLRPDVPEDCLPYLRTMQELDGPDHARLRRLVAPAFSARRAFYHRRAAPPRPGHVAIGVFTDHPLSRWPTWTL